MNSCSDLNLISEKSHLSPEPGFFNSIIGCEKKFADARHTHLFPQKSDCSSFSSLTSFETAASNSAQRFPSLQSSPIASFSPYRFSSNVEPDLVSVDNETSHEIVAPYFDGVDDKQLDSFYPSSPSVAGTCVMLNNEELNGDEFQSFGQPETSCISEQATGSAPDENENAPKNQRNPHKRKISNWYQESLVKSYRAKVKTFKKIFSSTPVDTDRLLVDYSCALAKNKTGLLLVGRMYITEKWVCFYSKIIYEQKLYFAIDDIESVLKAKTARFIPNAIQLTLKSGNERYFFTSFASRERTFAILKRVCENRLRGSRLLPSESEGHNMEELLCQVQDVYGDESLDVLQFEDAEDLEEEVYMPTRLVDPWSTLADSNQGPVSSPPVSQQRRRRRRRDSLAEGATASTAALPADYSFFSGDLSESDTTTTSLTSITTDDTDDYFDKEDNRADKSMGVEMDERVPRQEPSHHQQLHKRMGSKSSHPGGGGGGEKEEEIEDLGGPEICGTGHDHTGRTYADASINLSVDALFACLFTNSQFFGDFCTHRGTFDVIQCQWPPRPWPTPDTGDSTLQRNISYVLTLKQRFGPRTCIAAEKQSILLRETRPGRRYVIDAKVTNEAVPLCNSFHVTSRYCLLRRSATVSHLTISSEVVYDLPVFFGAKSMIESTCRSNLTDNFTDLVNQLSSRVSRLSDVDRITGGPLSRSFQRRQPAPTDNLGTPIGVPGDVRTVGADGEVRRVKGHRSPSTPAQSLSNTLPPTQRALSIPQALLCANQPSDRNWLFIVAAGLGLCLFLSVLFNRYQNLERLTPNQFEFGNPPPITSAPSCDEVLAVRLLSESLKTVLAQMEKALELLKRRIDNLESGSCQSIVGDVAFGK